MRVSFSVEINRAPKKERMAYAQADVVKVKSPHRKQIEVKDFDKIVLPRVKRAYTKKKK